MASEATLGEAMVEIKYLRQDVAEVKAEMQQLRAEVTNGFVSKAEFKAALDPLQRVVYGLTGAVLFAVAMAVIGLVVTS